MAAQAVVAARRNEGRQQPPVLTELPHSLHEIRAINNTVILLSGSSNHQFTAVGNDTAFFSYSSRLGNFILARFA